MGRYLGSKRRKTRRYQRDPDQILDEDMNSAKKIDALSHQDFDEEKPGLAQYYCIPCARYCESNYALVHHQRGKVHKRRLKELKEGPYTEEEAASAAGRDVAKFLAKQQKQRDIKAIGEIDTILNPPPKAEEPEEPEEEMDVEKSEDVAEEGAEEEPAVETDGQLIEA